MKNLGFVALLGFALLQNTHALLCLLTNPCWGGKFSSLSR